MKISFKKVSKSIAVVYLSIGTTIGLVASDPMDPKPVDFL